MNTSELTELEQKKYIALLCDDFVDKKKLLAFLEAEFPTETLPDRRQVARDIARITSDISKRADDFRNGVTETQEQK